MSLDLIKIKDNSNFPQCNAGGLTGFVKTMYHCYANPSITWFYTLVCANAKGAPTLSLSEIVPRYFLTGSEIVSITNDQ